jgi:hypothetical protein
MWFLVTLAALYAGLCVLLYLARNRLVFPITGGLAGEPARFGFPEGIAVTLATGDGAVLAGWLLPASAVSGPAPLLVWFPGNGETIAAIAPIIRDVKPPGVAVLALDYRGYGLSTGSAGVAHAERDAATMWRWLEQRPDVDLGRVVAYGRSVGSGPATALAASHALAGLILEAPFTSLRAMAAVHYRLFPARLAGAGFDNRARLDSVRCPILVIHGDADAIIPVAMGRELAERARDRSELVVVRGAGHNDVYDVGGEDYVRRIRDFVARVTTPRGTERWRKSPPEG